MTRSERPASGMLRAIVWGGLLAGLADALYATLYFGWLGASPVRIWQSVAGGLLTRERSVAGGLPTAALGLALHFFIAFTAAAVYVIASRRLPVLVQRAVLCGSLYGLWVYIFMNSVVIPLSALPPRKTSWIQPTLTFFTGLAVHVLGVGLGISLPARRAALRERGAD
jgi:uncharacterized membrane protein YagU involved in acid resistance